METQSPLFTKVFIVGLIQLVLTTVVEILSGTDEKSWYSIGFSLAIAIISYFARNLRGQAASIVSAIAAALISYFNLHGEPGPIDMKEIAVQLMTLLGVILGSLFSTPAKSIGYEHQPVIMKAKRQGEEETSTFAKPNPPTTV